MALQESSSAQPVATSDAQRPESMATDGLIERPWLLGSVLLVVAGLIFGLGMSFGYGWGRTVAQAAAPAPIAQPANGDAEQVLSSAFPLFWEAMDLLYHDFNGTLPTPQEATYGAIRGVVGLLKDPNTSFLSPDEATFFRSNVDGTFEGIGARVAWDEKADTLLITEPFENQPAWQAGLRRNDLVLAVNGESLAGTSVNDAVRLIRGPKGSDVVLTVQRADAPPFDLTVTRDLIAIPTIATNSLGEDGKIAYVKLNGFSENAGTLVREATKNALQHDPRAIIFDLRGNSGGLVREAVKVANVFTQDATVLLERFSDGHVETYTTSERAVTTDLPMVVLVNEGSASASEIVAGALQDESRATLIGTVTYGKGSVQLPHNLSDGSILRVTIARWFTPKNRTIDGVGLTPDIEVALSDEAIKGGGDPQLERAITFLSSAHTADGVPPRATPVEQAAEGAE